ncbi:MetQ/NlpA family ABC transporter substrate-binding protein [Methylobacterium nodulans]|uniref:NLPA lipoprotein n=1 Tax=Methylobacterium nodulans (strain LMG 21967 / CNCM I-2342 / ORS 2060) TaxID=460265 RepID=B8IE83_METNO|nr:MetQ/NlpA family ABC transporter substrate-binding protein [Methylobacterium nodulans]ACL57629.1 NLPA lipoprotein [Methylobacterium nodulans ORS 2060]
MRRMMLGVLLVLLGLSAVAQADEKPLRIGVTAGPVAQVVQFAAGLAKERGQRVEVVEFTDWVTPNEAVNTGDLDANLFQHGAFLALQNAKRGTKLVQVDPVGLIAPIGLFSKKLRSLEAVPVGGSVAIPNEPLNGARGLRLLEKAGLITLAPGKGLAVTKFDVVANPKKLDIIELDAAQLYRSLDDVTLAMVNLTYLIPAGGDPNSALLLDRSADDQFVLRFTAREDRKNDPRLRRFVETFKAPEVKSYIERNLPAFVPAWPGA